jgi:tRNA-splicing ligase RtcB (3'-phosphate/5'-hydroxy nucleic acid ligase)
MALIALDMEPPGPAAVADFFRRVRERYPWPPRARPTLRRAEVLACAGQGGRFAVDRFGATPEDLERVELGGRIAVDPERLRRELPWLLVQLARMRFGTVGPSNHFVELQRVEEVLDPIAAAALGLRAGQATLQYHGGGGVLAGEIGSLFVRRTRSTRPLAAAMAWAKPRYHLATARSAAELRARLSLYFSRGAPPIPRRGPEGERFMLANAAAMNYGFAYRLATYGALRRLAATTFGAPGARLVVDSPHNSIYEEEVGGRTAVVHRHNACRAFPPSRMAGHPVFGAVGQALLLPGLHTTSSYVCVASEGAALSLYSACHGSGALIAELQRRGRSGLDPRGRVTLEFGYSDAAPAEAPQLDDRGVREALGILTAHDLVRPVARLRPVAVLH